jgi:ADP-ribosylation factor-like protein 6
VTPTVGFQVEELRKNNINFTIFDMSGQVRSTFFSLLFHYFYLREDIEHYGNIIIKMLRSLYSFLNLFHSLQAIIFVIDSTDRLRMCVAKAELETLLQHANIRDTSIPIIFFANKV